MQLEKIERKFHANYQFGSARDSGSGGFILSDGSVVATTNHATCCERMGFKLADILEAGICRYASRPAAGGNVIAFEYNTLTMKQKDSARKMLKVDEYFKVVTKKATIDRNRPIRSINF